jgi:hypothetical protein
MYYAMMSGTLKRALFENDRNGIAFIYPCTLDGGCNPVPTATSTPQPTATTLPPTATSTATPTAMPTTSATPVATATTVTAVITNEGGGVVEYVPESGSQVLLVAPPGAVYTDTVISIAPVGSPPASPEAYTPLLSAFHITAGTTGTDEGEATFQTPITLTISYSITAGRDLPVDAIHLLMSREQLGEWEDISCMHQENEAHTHSLTASITHPAIFGLYYTDGNKLYLSIVTR